MKVTKDHIEAFKAASNGVQTKEALRRGLQAVLDIVNMEIQEVMSDVCKEADFGDFHLDRAYLSAISKVRPALPAVFVFGSNEAGIHGAGAAETALEYFGAEWGNGVGMQGNSYAIPTKDKKIKTLPLDKIQEYVKDFLEFAKDNKHLEFNVTAIGCGLAGYDAHDIAPMFKGHTNNVKLPLGWDTFSKA